MVFEIIAFGNAVPILIFAKNSRCVNSDKLTRKASYLGLSFLGKAGNCTLPSF
jgi:hypothetical protein